MAARKNLSPVTARAVDPGDDPCGPAATSHDCRCHAAVTRAYRSMQASGVSDGVALDAAVRVYRYHHPEAAEMAAQHTVEAWVFRGTVH